MVVAAWRQIQRDNTLETDDGPVAPAPTAAPASPKVDRSEPTASPAAGSALFTPSIDEKSSKADLYKVATELDIDGRSKMNKGELLEAIRAAS